MAMQVIKQSKSKIQSILKMRDLKDGQIARVLGNNRIVMCIKCFSNKSIYLIIEDIGETNNYNSNCSLLVELLKSDESVLIEFSNK